MCIRDRYSKESLTGQINTEWVDDLKDIIKRMNERYSHKPYTDEQLDENMEILTI